MMDSETKHIHIADYNYPLPSERIAKYPLKERDQSKLLLYRQGEVGEDVFENLSAYLPKGSLLVFNNTRVIQARIHFRKETGALIEVFLMEPAQPTDYERIFQATGHCAWLCMVGNLKKWKEGALTKVCTVKGKDVTLQAQLDRSRRHSSAVAPTTGWTSHGTTTASPLPRYWMPSANCPFRRTSTARRRRRTRRPIRRSIRR